MTTPAHLRDLTPAQRDAVRRYAAEVVAEAPPLTAAQRQWLRVLLAARTERIRTVVA